MERKKIRSECEFIGFEDNRLKYKCKECNDISVKSVDDLIENFLITHKFCNGNRNKFVLLLRVFILMRIWIAGKDLMKHHYHPKKIFIAN